MRIFSLIIALFMSFFQQVFAAEAANLELDTALKSNAHEPNAFSIIFALLFVIFLIYITGLIYSRLNIVGAKTIKEQLRNYDLNTVVVLSTKQLGQGKNLHVIELDNKRYLIGAAQNSITLLKELGDAPAPKKSESDADFLVGEPEPKVDDFDVHKKYL